MTRALNKNCESNCISEVDNRFAVFEKEERKMQTINSKLGIQVKELHTHGEEKRK